MADTKPGTTATRETRADRKRREDGWSNVLTGIGQATTDKRQSTRFVDNTRIPDTMLTGMYRSNGLTHRIVSLPPMEMTRNWFTIHGDEEDVALQKLEELGAQEKYKDALTWARLYGGAVILMGLYDGGNASRAVNTKSIREVMYLQVFDQTDVEILPQSISNDIDDPMFGQPTEYRITPVTGGTPFTVHASRLIRFDGAKVPNRTLLENNGWHDSVMQFIYEQIRQVGAVYDNSEIIVEDFIQTIVKIDNLLDMIMAGQDEKIKQRINLIDLSRHVANALVMDSTEDYAKHSSTVTGIDTLLDRFMMYLSGITGIPVTKLWGRSPAGQNATGESDLRMWYDDMRAEQRVELCPRLETLITYIYAAAGKEPETWSIEFNPLWEMTEKEHSDVYKTNAEGDQIYVDMGADPSALIRYRVGGATYNATPPTIPQDDLDEQENAARLKEEERAKLQAEAEAAAAAAAQNE
jgi:phage-related protein (TIGR01555 family)